MSAFSPSPRRTRRACLWAIYTGHSGQRRPLLCVYIRLPANPMTIKCIYMVMAHVGRVRGALLRDTVLKRETRIKMRRHFAQTKKPAVKAAVACAGSCAPVYGCEGPPPCDERRYRFCSPRGRMHNLGRSSAARPGRRFCRRAIMVSGLVHRSPPKAGRLLFASPMGGLLHDIRQWRIKIRR